MFGAGIGKAFQQLFGMAQDGRQQIVEIMRHPAGKLAEAARKWSSAEIADAINGLVELDAISKGDGERAWGPALTRWSAARIR